jgi:hypothetical protein
VNRLLSVAPDGNAVTEYDRVQLSLYAALLDAKDVGISWRQVVRDLMKLDPDGAGAEACWRSHLERARWITGSGLASALEAFEQARL